MVKTEKQKPITKNTREGPEAFNWLKAYHFQKGQSGNPKGRPKGKSLKEFAREFLENLTEEDKVAYLRSLPAEIVWRMSEGNPHTTEDKKITVQVPTPILGGASQAHNLGSVESQALTEVVKDGVIDD